MTMIFLHPIVVVVMTGQDSLKIRLLYSLEHTVPRLLPYPSLSIRRSVQAGVVEEDQDAIGRDVDVCGDVSNLPPSLSRAVQQAFGCVDISCGTYQSRCRPRPACKLLQSSLGYSQLLENRSALTIFASCLHLIKHALALSSLYCLPF